MSGQLDPSAAPFQASKGSGSTFKLSVDAKPFVPSGSFARPAVGASSSAATMAAPAAWQVPMAAASGASAWPGQGSSEFSIGFGLMASPPPTGAPDAGGGDESIDSDDDAFLAQQEEVDRLLAASGLEGARALEEDGDVATDGGSTDDYEAEDRDNGVFETFVPRRAAIAASIETPADAPGRSAVMLFPKVADNEQAEEFVASPFGYTSMSPVAGAGRGAGQEAPAGVPVGGADAATDVAAGYSGSGNAADAGAHNPAPAPVASHTAAPAPASGTGPKSASGLSMVRRKMGKQAAASGGQAPAIAPAPAPAPALAPAPAPAPAPAGSASASTLSMMQRAKESRAKKAAEKAAARGATT